MNKKSTDKPHFNVADIIIIIAIIAVVTAFALRIYNVFGTKDDGVKVRIEFEVENISSENLSLAEETKFYCSSDNSYAGYLEAFDIKNTIKYAYNENGELVKATVPGRSNVTGTLVIECVKTDKGFYLGGNVLLSEGGTLMLYSTTREMVFNIKKITEIKVDQNGSEITTSTPTAASTAATTVQPVQ